MKFGISVGMILAAVCLQSVVAQNQDTLWMCRDDTPEVLWVEMNLADTFPDNRGRFSMVDTGDSYNGTPYINFDYQFSTDSVHIPGKTPMDVDTVFSIGPRPGYAGFKVFWDNGIMSFYAGSHDSMILWHKGPLPGHKVKMIWAQGSAGCGTPINYEDFTEFKSSTEWKREAFSFPAGFVKDGLFELRMLIYNDSTAGTPSETSPPGCLKIDDMFFLRNNNPVKNPKIVPGVANGPRSFVPKVSGKVMLSVFSLQGEQLFKEFVDVTAGKEYDVTRFARQNSNLPARWIHCVQITGAGVNITRKVIR